MKITKLVTGAILALVPTIHAAPVVTSLYSGATVTSLTVNAQQLIATKQTVQVFDRSLGGYGSVTKAITIEADPAGLNFTIVVVPAANITRLEIQLPKLAVGSLVGQSTTSSINAGYGDVPVAEMTWSGGKWYATDEQPTSYAADCGQIHVGSSNGGPWPVNITSYKLLEANRTYTFNYRYVFTDFGTTIKTACPDETQAWLWANSRNIRWVNRGAIASNMMATVGRQVPVTNPRAWFPDNKPAIDITTPAGLQALHDAAVSRVNYEIWSVKQVNGQGVIFWDLEGAERSGMMYVGDPRVIPVMAPEMDAIADELMGLVKNAGLSAGICIRDNKVLIDGSAVSYVEYPSENERMWGLIGKLQYLSDRWDCRMVYLDSWKGQPDTLRTLSMLFPQILIMPEQPQPTMFFNLYAAPFLKADKPFAKDQTPAVYRDINPDAFSILDVSNLNPANQAARAADIKNGVANGDVFLFRGWGGKSWADYGFVFSYYGK